MSSSSVASAAASGSKAISSTISSTRSSCCRATMRRSRSPSRRRACRAATNPSGVASRPGSRTSASGSAAARSPTSCGISSSRAEKSGSSASGRRRPGETEGLLPHRFCRALETALPDAALVDFTGDFTDFMLVKSAEELALLRFAAFVSEQASARMAASARPGIE